MSTVTLSRRFQVVVPQDVRELMRLRPGQKFQVFHEDGQILLVPVVPMKRARGFARGINTEVRRGKGDRVVAGGVTLSVACPSAARGGERP